MTNPGDLSLDDRLDRIEAKLDQLVIDVAGLKARSALWGAVAGGVVGVLAAALSAIIGHLQ